MQIAIVFYQGFTALDALGPYEVLKMLPGVEIRFVANEVGPVATDRGILIVGATHTFAETSAPDVVLVPGSEAHTAIAASDRRLTDWLRRVQDGTRYTTSVCSGAVILGAAGLLKGRPATSHWAAMGSLARFGATPRPMDRIVRSDHVWTAAGVSAGIDLAFALAEELTDRETAERIQLMLEYDPIPPQNAGHVSKASYTVADSARAEIARLSRNPMTGMALAKIAWQSFLANARKQAARAAKLK